jgi:uncharacterized membrane protein (DUF373 family)
MNFNLETISKRAIKLILKILLAALYIILVYSLIEFLIILFNAIINHPISFSFNPVDKSSPFLELVLPLLSAVLLMMIVVEMIESIIDFIKFDRTSYIYIITEIALIAMIRHLITIDLHHINAFEVVAVGLLIISVASFYIALKVIKK